MDVFLPCCSGAEGKAIIFTSIPIPRIDKRFLISLTAHPCTFKSFPQKKEHLFLSLVASSQHVISVQAKAPITLFSSTKEEFVRPLPGQACSVISKSRYDIYE